MSMNAYLTAELMGILESILREAFQDVCMEQAVTLPALTQEAVDRENAELIRFYFWKKKNLADATRTQYGDTLRRFCLTAGKALRTVGEMDIEMYLDSYMHRKLTTAGRAVKNSPTTMNNERRNLYSFFTFLRQQKIRPDNPVENIEKYKETRKPIDYYSKEQLIALRDACIDTRERALIEVFHSTAGRVGEIIEIKRDEVDWYTGDIMIASEKSGGYRTIYLDDQARWYLKRYLMERKDSTPQLFVGKRAPYRKLSREAVRSIMNKIKARAGITCRVYPHKMRKTLGMELRNSGVDIGVIQEIMGHANPGVTAQYYAQSTPDTIREIRRRAAA